MTEIKIRLDLIGGLEKFVESTINKKPSSSAASKDTITLNFIPNLTAQEKQALNNELPQWFKTLFSIEVS